MSVPLRTATDAHFRENTYEITNNIKASHTLLSEITLMNIANMNTPIMWRKITSFYRVFDSYIWSRKARYGTNKYFPIQKRAKYHIPTIQKLGDEEIPSQNCAIGFIRLT